MTDYSIKAKFEKDNKHLGSISNQSKITFQKTTPTLNISIPAGTYNAESNFNIQVTPKNPDGTAIIVPRIPIKFYIDDVLVKSDTTQQKGYYGTLYVCFKKMQLNFDPTSMHHGEKYANEMEFLLKNSKVEIVEFNDKKMKGAFGENLKHIKLRIVESGNKKRV